MISQNAQGAEMCKNLENSAEAVADNSSSSSESNHKELMDSNQTVKSHVVCDLRIPVSEGSVLLPCWKKNGEYLESIKKCD